MAKFTVNGRAVTVENNQKLLRYLRDTLHLTSVKDGCSEGACGTCTVLIDGKPTKACIPQTDKLEGKSIVTVEGQHTRWPSTLLTYDTPLDWSGGRILGGKTGYTKRAGQCLASYAEVDGELYYLVTLGAPGEAGGSGQHLADARTLYSWAAAQRR